MQSFIFLNWFKILLFMQCNNSKNTLGNYSMCTCSVAQPWQTLCTLMGWSLLCSSVHGIFFFFFQVRILEWVAFSSFGGSSPKGIQMVAPEMSTLSGGFFTTEPPMNPNCSISQFSYSVLSNCLWPHGLQHTRLLCPSPTPGAYSISCPLNRWCHPTILSSVIPFSSCLKSFPASESFPMSQWPRYWSFSFSISPSNE